MEISVNNNNYSNDKFEEFRNNNVRVEYSKGIPSVTVGGTEHVLDGVKGLVKAESRTDFAAYIEGLTVVKNPHNFIAFVADGTFELIDINFKTGIIARSLSYKFENPFIGKVFEGLYGKEKASFIRSDRDNFYELGINAYAMEVCLLAADKRWMKSQGEKVEDLVKRFDLKTKSKVRHIVAPVGEFKIILKKMNHLLQAKYDKINDIFQVAYKKGKSIKDNALPHQDHKFVFKTDIHDFFPSCSRSVVEPVLDFMFKNAGQNASGLKAVKDVFYDTILDKNALYIGSPISGVIANTIIAPAVLKIRSEMMKYAVTVTVYADDITFSSSKRLYKSTKTIIKDGKPHTYKGIVDVVNECFAGFGLGNFSLNEKKCYGQSNNRRCITGVVFNNEDQMTIHRYHYGMIRQCLYELSKGNKDFHFNMNKLRGEVAFALPVDHSDKFCRLFKKYHNVLVTENIMKQENYDKFMERFDANGHALPLPKPAKRSTEAK